MASCRNRLARFHRVNAASRGRQGGGLRRVWGVVRRRAPGGILRLLARYRLPQTLVCAPLTSRPLRFTVHEVRGGGRVGRHRLRDSGLVFHLRHGTADIGILDEIFRLGYYTAPPSAAERLRRSGRPLRILDLGAHVGLFGLWALHEHPGAQLVAFEPDPLNSEALHTTIHANGLQDRWTVVRACAAAKDGFVVFAAGRSSGSMVVESGEEGLLVRAVDALPYLPGVDLVKMDMEGGEWALLQDPRFAGVAPPVIVIEYHPHLCPVPDAREHVKSLLARAGYGVAEIFHHSNRVGMLWGVQRA